MGKLNGAQRLAQWIVLVEFRKPCWRYLKIMNHVNPIVTWTVGAESFGKTWEPKFVLRQRTHLFLSLDSVTMNKNKSNPFSAQFSNHDCLSAEHWSLAPGRQLPVASVETSAAIAWMHQRNSDKAYVGPPIPPARGPASRNPIDCLTTPNCLYILYIYISIYVFIIVYCMFFSESAFGKSMFQRRLRNEWTV